MRSIEALVASGKAYRCYCTPRSADEVIQDLEAGKGRLYDGRCRRRVADADGASQPYAIRFALPEDFVSVQFDDIIRGTVTVKREQLDDFVIARQDGWPTYNLGNVLDDHFMGITHVIRGEDHLSNTVKQILLYQAFDYQVPQFAHLPLILGRSGGKLSKRDAAVSVEEYRAQGFLAGALFNYLVRLGWSHGDQEVFTRDELIRYFSLDHVGKKGAVFDMDKLTWLNGVYLRDASYHDLCQAVACMDAAMLKQLRVLWSEKHLEALFGQYQQRTATLAHMINQISSFAQDPRDLDMGLLATWWS